MCTKLEAQAVKRNKVHTAASPYKALLPTASSPNLASLPLSTEVELGR